jgi:hypothetical protein
VPYSKKKGLFKSDFSMDKLRELFPNKWNKYSTKADLPIAYYYVNEAPEITSKRHSKNSLIGGIKGRSQSSVLFSRSIANKNSNRVAKCNSKQASTL